MASRIFVNLPVPCVLCVSNPISCLNVLMRGENLAEAKVRYKLYPGPFSSPAFGPTFQMADSGDIWKYLSTISTYDWGLYVKNSRSMCHIITRTFYQPHSSFCVVESHYFICLTVNMKMLSLIIIIIVQAEMRNDGLYFTSVRTSSARR